MIRPIHCGNARRIAQSGQALTEFLVVAVALLPLFLLVPVIAKYQDIAHATQMASRYAAFDTLVRNASQNSVKPLNQLQNEVRRRFYSNSNTPIRHLDPVLNDRANQNLFWSTPDDNSLITSLSSVIVTRSRQTTRDGSLTAVNPGPFAYRLGGTGIDNAEVTVKLANLTPGMLFYEPFDDINLSMRRSTSVVGDGWSAKDATDLQGKLAPLVPATTLMPPLAALVTPAIMVVEPGVTPPKLGQLDFWRDDVPPDRLRRPH